MHGRRPGSRWSSAGFTMIEVTVTIGLMSVLMTFAVGGWSSWSRAHGHQGAAVDIQSTLRHAQQRAVTEGGAVCVRFDPGADTWQLERGACTGAPGAVIGGPWQLDEGLELAAPAFTHESMTMAGVTFTSRGTASPGSVRVVRPGSSTSHEVTVEGLTGRVSTS